MSNLLKVLVSELRTIDGSKGSAIALTKAITKQSGQPARQVENNLYKKVMLKYLIMRVRSKISYEAFVQ